MAVYTHVPDDTLAALLQKYEIGDPLTFEGAVDGVENTNYFLTTTRGRYILTLFEKRVSHSDLPFFVSLMHHLAAKSFPAPAPVADANGVFLHSICGRPATIVTCLPGSARLTPNAVDCAALGAVLARLHIDGADFNQERRNDLGPEGWRNLAGACVPTASRCAPDLGAVITEELDFLAPRWPEGLPHGVIHADLFPDNAFFQNESVTGVIDFYFSCTDFYAYDLAVCLISWASTSQDWSAQNATALMAGYQSVRRLSRDERGALPILMRGAALRFLLTRLFDWLNQVEGAVVNVKNPLEYRGLLMTLQTSSPESLYEMEND